MFDSGVNQNQMQWEYQKPFTEYSKEALNQYRRTNVGPKIFF